MEKTRGNLVLSDDDEYGLDSFGASTDVSNDSCGSLKRTKLDTVAGPHLAQQPLPLPEPGAMPLIVSPTDFNKAIDQLIEGASGGIKAAERKVQSGPGTPTLDPSTLKPEVEMPTLHRARRAGNVKPANRKRGAEM